MKIFEQRQWITSTETINLLGSTRQELQLILDEGLLSAFYDTRKDDDLVYCSSSVLFSAGYELKNQDILAVSHFIRKEENDKYLEIDIDQSFPRGIANYEDGNSCFCPILNCEDISRRVVLVELNEHFFIVGLAEKIFSLSEFSFKKSDVMALINKKGTVNLKSECMNEAESKNKTISPLMKIAYEIWDEHYSTLVDGEPQPTKDYLIAWIKNRHPKLSTNQAEALYNVTRRDPPNL